MTYIINTRIYHYPPETLTNLVTKITTKMLDIKNIKSMILKTNPLNKPCFAHFIARISNFKQPNYVHFSISGIPLFLLYRGEHAASNFVLLKFAFVFKLLKCDLMLFKREIYSCPNNQLIYQPKDLQINWKLIF